MNSSAFDDGFPMFAPVSILCQQLEFGDDVKWTFVWKADTLTMSVLDGGDKFFEKKLSTAERQQLLGNTNPALLEDKWQKLFVDENLTLSVDEEADIAAVGGIRGVVTLPRVNAAEKFPSLMNAIIGAFVPINQLQTELKNMREADQIRKIAAARLKKSVTPLIRQKQFRPRAAPTGLVFDDEKPFIPAPQKRPRDNASDLDVIDESEPVSKKSC